MYPNLRAEIKRRGLLMSQVANHIGVTESTFSLKMNGKLGFTLKEAFAIQEFLKTHLTIDELFLPELEGEE